MIKETVPLNPPPPGPTQAGWHSVQQLWRCEKEHQLANVRQIIVPLHRTPEPLGVGLLWHAGRARWFSRNFKTDAADWKSIKDAVIFEAQRQKLPVSLKAEQRAMELLNLYTAYWAPRPLPQPLHAEYEIGPAPLAPGDPFALFRTARLDDVSRYPEGGNELWLGEGKTTSGSPQDVLQEYELNGQTLLQKALWDAAPQGGARHGPIAGIMLDVIKKPSGKNGPAFARIPLRISNHSVEWFVQNLRFKLRRQAAIEWDTATQRNVTACTRMIGRMRIDCPFKALCQHGRDATSQYLFADGKSLTTWKPGDGKETAPWL